MNPDDKLDDALLCLSARPETPEAMIFGVVERVDDGAQSRRVAYLNDPQPVSPPLLELAGSLAPGEIFRFAAPCARSGCAHFDGVNCRLASRIVNHLAEAVFSTPACRVRPRCRWFHQEGRAACLRCPGIASELIDPPEVLRSVAEPELLDSMRIKP